MLPSSLNIYYMCIYKHGFGILFHDDSGGSGKNFMVDCVLCEGLESEACSSLIRLCQGTDLKGLEVEIFPLFWVGEGWGGLMGKDISKAIRNGENVFYCLTCTTNDKRGAQNQVWFDVRHGKCHSKDHFQVFFSVAVAREVGFFCGSDGGRGH